MLYIWYFKHGCHDCYGHVPDLKTHRDGLTISELYQRTQRRLFILHTKGYEVHVKWECEFLKELKNNPELKKQYDAIWIPKPLDPRGDALRGGPH